MSVMIESGLDISPVITHRMSFRDFQQGFDVMSSGEASKVVLNWED
jgi:threonine 3-dehydrogenase